MFYKYLRHLHLLLALLAILTLAGCAGENRFGQTDTFHDSADAEDTQATEDPDLGLESAEPRGSLDQELAALSQTGMWDGETSPVTKRDLENSIYSFPVVLNKQVQMYLNLFQTRQRDIFTNWLSRSSIYLPLMKRELKNAGLPEELVYLSMIESGYNQRACSPANAVGLWQFMDGTGRQYNLDVNKYVDERRDAEKSTKAAVAYLSELYAEFGDWHLAVAAYNAGPGKIRKGMEKYNVSSFWALAREDYLALETKRYVPKLIAAIILAKDPEKYGFNGAEYKHPLQYATLKVPPGMSLEALALVCNSSVKEIKFLNQELRMGKTPPNRPDYEAKIPVASQEVASKNIARLHSVVSTGYKSHRIKRGESLATICRMYGINTTTLLKVNNLRSKRLARGQYLRIPYNTVSYQLLPEGSTIAQAGSMGNNLILHRIRAGETISRIAKKYNVSPEEIMAWNNLESAHKIGVGQQIALYPANKAIMTVSETVLASVREEDQETVAVSSRTNAKKTARVLTAIKKKTSHDIATRTSGRNTIAPSHVVRKNAPAGQAIAQSSPVKTSPVKSIPALSIQKKKPRMIAAASRTNYSWYKVQDGDTLWTISKKFNTSSVLIKQWNNLKSDVIHPGRQLKMKRA